MPWARASSLHRHLMCPASSNLIRLDRGAWRPGYLGAPVPEPPPPVVPENDSAARWGTAMHAAVAGESDDDPWRTWANAVHDGFWPADLGEHEVTFGYSVETGRVHVFRSRSEDERTAWKMATPDDYVVGTADWAGNLPDGTSWVCDLKTGWSPPDPLNPANLFYLMCKAMLDDTMRGRSSILHWPRKSDMTESEPRRVWSPLVRADQLLAFEADLRDAYLRVRTGEAVPGAHCHYCPSAGVCPAVNDYATPDPEETP